MITPELTNSMFEASVLGFRYHRVLAERVDPTFTAALKTYDYSFIVSYGPFDDPDYEVVDKSDAVIDLTRGMEHVLAGFSSGCRNQVRKTDRIDGLTFHDPNHQLESLYRFHTQCELARGWIPVPEDELQNSVVISASFQGELISAISCYESANRLRIGRIFSKRRTAEAANIPGSVLSAAARRIVLKLCEYGSQRGCVALDLAGIDVDDVTKAGITRFKMSFGPEVVPVKIGRYRKPEFIANQQRIREMGWDVT